MRAKLIGTILVLATGVALIASVHRVNTAPTGQDPPVATETRAGSTNMDAMPGPGREPLPAAGARLAVSGKLLPPGTKSVLKVPARLEHGDFLWNEAGVPAGKMMIWVDLRRQMVSAFRNGHEIGTAVIVYGANDMPSPQGVFRILRKSRDYHSRTYDAPMPHSLFITNDGVALHGSPMSKRRASHGCIGLPTEFARKLFETASVGDIVEITRSNPALGT